MLILVILGIYFYAVVVFVTSQTLLLELALTIIGVLVVIDKKTMFFKGRTLNLVL